MNVRTKTVLVIVATLLIGILIGALGSSFVVHRFIGRVAEMRHRDVFVERLVETIDPEPEQEEVVRDILTRHSERFSEMSERFRSETTALLDSLKAELDTVLTDEQKARLEEKASRVRRASRHHYPRGHKPGDERHLPPPPPPPEEDG